MDKKRIKAGILLLYVIFISCLGRELYLRYRWNISGLSHKDISFSELPPKVKKYLQNPDDYKNEHNQLEDLVCLDDSNRYQSVTIWIGPWVDYHKIVDNKKKRYYRIDNINPSQYIIYDSYLYIFYDWDNYYKWKEKEYESIKMTRYKLNYL